MLGSTGACVGHVSPEALAGGPVGKLRDGDMVEIVVDRTKLEGHVNFVGEAGEIFDAEEGHRRLLNRPLRADLRPDPALPEDTRLWAVLQQASGGIWGECVYDAEAILDQIKRARLVYWRTAWDWVLQIRRDQRNCLSTV